MSQHVKGDAAANLLRRSCRATGFLQGQEAVDYKINGAVKIRGAEKEEVGYSLEIKEVSRAPAPTKRPRPMELAA